MHVDYLGLAELDLAIEVNGKDNPYENEKESEI